MIKIINATNLLGDSLYAINAIKLYIDTNVDDEIDIVADKGLAYEMYKETFKDQYVFSNLDEAIYDSGDDSFEVLKLSAGDSGTICFESAQKTGKQLHITQGFSQLLGMEYGDRDLMPYAPWKDSYDFQDPKIIGIAPFSKSCSRHSGDRPNKTLDDWKWNHLLGYLRQYNSPIEIFGGPNDRLQQVAASEEEYFSAGSFKDLCRHLRSCRLFVTVDNGLGHLASVLNVPTIILWPVVSSIGFIAPLWAPRTRYIQMEPNSATPAAILSGLRPYAKDLLNEETTEA